MSCLAKKPAERPQTVGDILKALEPLDQRFSKGRQLSQRIESTLTTVPVVAEPKAPAPLSETDVERMMRLQSWPKNKPTAEIVFTHPFRTSAQKLASLWVMLKKEDIQKRLVCKRYNQFLFLMSPHPMLLWITVLYTRDAGPKWLPCYLDMKTPQGQEMAKLLGESGRYRVLLFALEDSKPQPCSHVITVSIDPSQCQLLQQWVTTSQSLISVASANMSKDLLKAEFDKLKPQILKKLE